MNTVKVPENTRYDIKKRSALTVQNAPEGNKTRANMKDRLRPTLTVTSKSAQRW